MATRVPLPTNKTVGDHEVTLHYPHREQIFMKKKGLKRRNLVAKSLAEKQNRPRVVEDRTKYRRNRRQWRND